MIKVRSLFQLRLYRFIYMFIVGLVVWSIFEIQFEEEFKFLGVVVFALLFSLMFAFLDEMSSGQGITLFLDKTKRDEFVDDMELLGFKGISSKGEKAYMYRKGEVLWLKEQGRHLRAELPSKYEYVGEKYRSL